MSAAWRVAQESWWPVKALDEFKLRASRGTAGTRPDFSDQYETFDFTEGGRLIKETLGNRFLNPEHATETEFGIDAIFRQRYSLQVSYAKNKVVDQLILIPLAGFFGYESQWQNAGTVEGNRLEGTLEAQLIRKPGFTWRMGIIGDGSETRSESTAVFHVDNDVRPLRGANTGRLYGSG